MMKKFLAADYADEDGSENCRKEAQKAQKKLPKLISRRLEPAFR
jgi:hypothetical protein